MLSGRKETCVGNRAGTAHLRGASIAGHRGATGEAQWRKKAGKETA